eukprot:Em0144g11a
MPGKVKSKDACDGEATSKKPKAPPKKRGGRKMPPPLPSGEVLTDLAKGRWILGTSVGKGGFGEIYLASPEGSSAMLAAAKHVVKIEPHENGPLFTELSVYHRVAKPQSINDWVKKKGLRFLGVPKYIASGSHTHDSMQYRFMVMERYGNDLQKAFEEGGKKFSVKTICYLALRLLEALEYLHESEYVHADIKAANILVGHEAKQEVCLVDYGLAYRYKPEGVHKIYKEDPRRKHDGTIEFTSIDAHKGANPSRRGDLEILGYCMLQWSCGQLPWEGFLDDKDRVAQQKMKYRDEVDGLMTACFGSAPPSPACLKDYFQYVYKLGYEEEPDYEMLKGLFLRALKSSGQCDDYTGLDWIAVTQGKKNCSRIRHIVMGTWSSKEQQSAAIPAVPVPVPPVVDDVPAPVPPVVDDVPAPVPPVRVQARHPLQAARAQALLASSSVLSCGCCVAWQLVSLDFGYYTLVNTVRTYVTLVSEVVRNEHAWKRFRLAAVAKQWQAEKQLLILPTLLRGNLVDYYMDLGEDEKRSLEDVKQALERKAGIKKDPIVAARYFNSRYQDDRERVMDYATQLRKAFKEAYPEEDVGSEVLLQTFLSGLRPSIAHQVMLKGRPTVLDKAIEEAVTVEEALRFGGADTMEVPVHAVHPKETTTEVEQLRHMLERMSQKFESFEQQLKELDAGRATDNNSVERERRSSEKRVSFKLQRGSSQEDGGGRRRNTCFLCGKEEKGRIRHSNVQVMGANGSPLDVMGVLSLKLGSSAIEVPFIDSPQFTVRHKAGKINGNADGLSRTPSIQLAAATSQVESSDNFAKIKEAQAKDAYMVLVYEAVKDGDSESGDSEVCIQMLIPLEMRSSILEHLHNRAGHMGVKRTLERVRHRFYWLGYESDVERWVRECETCQKRNNPQPLPQAPLGTISASHPFQKITWDIMGPLPVTSKGNKYILVVTDVFSKWVEAFPLQITDGLTLTSILMDEVICRYGVPQQLHSDQGSNLNAEVNQRLCQMLGIERSRTTAYHPQGNGQVERFNRTVEAILAKMVGEHQDDWDKHLQKAVFASLHESTGNSPYFVSFGRSPVLPIDVMLGRFGTIPQYIKEVKTTLKMAYDVIRENLDVAQKKRKERRDKHCAEVNFKVGDRVWLFNPAVKVGETRKLSSQWRGPYTVIDRVSPVNYKIQLIGTTKTQTVHHNRMKMCHGDPEKWNSEQSNEDDPVVLPDDASFDLGFECGGVERSIVAWQLVSLDFGYYTLVNTVRTYVTRKSPEVITSPFSKAKRRPVEEEVDAGDEVSQIKPTKAKGVRKQAVTKTRNSPKGRKRPSGEEEVEASPPKKVKVNKDTGSSDDEPQIKPIKPKAIRKRAATKKASPPEDKSPTAVNDALDDGEERTREEEGVDSGSPKELHETKATKQVRAVGKKQPKSKPLPTTQPGKIPEVTYPASLGYVNDLDNGSSSVEPRAEEPSRPKRSRRLNPTT